MSKTSAFFLDPGHIKCLPQGCLSELAVHNWFLKDLEDAVFEWASHALGLSIVYRPQAQAPGVECSAVAAIGLANHNAPQ